MATGGETPTFVGRARERELIAELLDEVRAGAGTALLIEGEAGIGKTRLVEEATSTATRAEFQVLRGECDESARVRPFTPFAQAFSRKSPATATLDARLGKLLDPDTAGESTGLAPASQFRIVEAIGAVVERLAARTPIILVIEDLHWADGPTLVALRSIGRRIGQLPVLLVGTFRPGHDIAELHQATEDLLRGGSRRLLLGPLDDEAVADLASDVLRASPGPSLLERLRGAAGNPLFVIEFTRALLQQGNLDTESVAPAAKSSEIPLEFRHMVLRRIGQLSDRSAAALRIASVLGSTFSPADLAVALRQDSMELVVPLQEAVEKGVIAEQGDELGFVHELVREAVYDSIPLAVRNQVHREIGQALAAAGREPLTVAHHLSAGADERDEGAAEWLQRAARDVAVRAPAVAVDLLERARQLLRPGDPLREQLLADLVMPLAWSGRLADAHALAQKVLESRPPPAIAGPLRCGLVYALTWQGRPVEALQYAAVEPGDAFSERDDVLLGAHRSLAKMFAFDLRGAAVDAAAAAERAASIGHDLALCTALGVQTFLGGFSGETMGAIELGRGAVGVADRSATPEPHLAAPRFFLSLPLIAADLLDEAEEVLQEGRRIAEDLGHAWSLPLYQAFLGTTRFVRGEWDNAIAEFEASLAVADEVGVRLIAGIQVAAWLSVIHVHRGDFERADDTLAMADRRVAEGGPQIGMSLLAWARALLHEARGDTQAGLTALQATWDFSVAAGLQAEPWSGAALVRMYARSGQPDRALPIVPIIEAQGTRIPTPFMKGRALASRGLAESDPHKLMQAVDLYRECPRIHELALACEDAAIVLGRAGRRDEAMPLFDEAMEIYDPAWRGARRRPSPGRAAFTRREA